jgi:predicted lysophospholipase L1 biosynthesis ABC-type transport system permease subunit
MGFARGSLALGSLAGARMGAHRLVIAAAALTVAVAAALATALATFSGQALPHAVQRDLATANGTALVVTGNVDASQAAQYASVLPGQIASALDGTAFAFYRADWSDPLGFVPGALPAAPASRGNHPITEAASLGGLPAHAVLTSGRWPGNPSGGQPIPAALPATAALLLHVTVGDVLRLKDQISGQDIRFAVTGLYRPRQVTSQYWFLDDIAPSGSSTLGGFTTYGPLAVPPAAFAGLLTVNNGSWLAQPQTGSIPAGRLRAVAGQVTGLQQTLASAQGLPDLMLATSLPAVLDGTASNLDLSRSLLAICAVLLILLVGAALLAVARLLAGERENESAMLAARGASRWQQLKLAAAEAIPLCLVSSAAGGVIGVLLAGNSNTLVTGGTAVPAALGNAWPAAAVVAVAGVVIILLPALTALTPGAARARRGRQAAISGVTRAGADLALVVLAVLAGWQLRHYSAVSAGANGNFGVDPVVVAAPALALAGGTVLALRLLPAGARAGDRLAARGRRLTGALASWQISRQPVRQGGAALLIVLAVATGTLTFAQRQSWTRSADDQAAFTVGADVQVQAGQPLSAAQAAALARVPGVQHAMPVVSVTEQATGAQVIALDARQAPGVVLLRADQSPLPEAGLFARLRPAGPPAGIALPGRPAAIRLAASLAATGSPGLAPAIVTLTVADADGGAYQLDAGALPADGRSHTLIVSLGGQAAYPLRLLGINVGYTLPATARNAAVLTVTSLSGGPGTAPVPGSALRALAPAVASPELAGTSQTAGTARPSGLPGPSQPPALLSSAVQGSALVVTFGTGYGLGFNGFHGHPPKPVPPTPLAGELALAPHAALAAVPGVATQAFLAASNAGVGSVVQASIDGTVIGVRVIAAVTAFPTVTGSHGALIVDLGAVQAVLAEELLQPAQVTQWWLATAPGGSAVPPGLAAAVPPGSAVTSTAAQAAGLLGNPLSSVPQQALLAIAVAAAVLAVTGFGVSIVADLRQRRAESALLAALGVPPRAAAGQLCLEKLMLSVPSATVGLVLGAVLAELLVPAVTLTTSGAAPVPPVLIEIGWSGALLLALAVAVLPVLAAAAAVVRRPDAAAGLRAAEAA